MKGACCFTTSYKVIMEKLIVIGAGGYAKSVLDSVDIYNYEIVGFIDEFTSEKVHIVPNSST